MKFESKYGIGEIVLYITSTQKKGFIHDEMFKIMSVIFNGDDTVNYVARRPDGMAMNFMEHEIVGDPDFNEDDINATKEGLSKISDKG